MVVRCPKGATVCPLSTGWPHLELKNNVGGCQYARTNPVSPSSDCTDGTLAEGCNSAAQLRFTAALWYSPRVVRFLPMSSFEADYELTQDSSPRHASRLWFCPARTDVCLPVRELVLRATVRCLLAERFGATANVDDDNDDGQAIHRAAGGEVPADSDTVVEGSQ